jgi:xylulokinase
MRRNPGAKMNFIGIDLGTTSIKAAVFDETGRRLALRSVEYTLDTGTPGFVEFPAGWYVDICRELIDSLAAEYPVAALAVDSQGETLVFADGEGTPLCPAVNWTDIRAVTEAGMIEEKFGRRRVYEVTGQPEITGGWPASKLLWFGRNRPDIFSRTKKIFLLEDWIIYKLCGAFVSEPTLQSSTIYFDIRRRCWWDEMLDFIGVSRSMLPEIVPCGSIVGKYNGILVVTGALDQIAGSLGGRGRVAGEP